MWRSDSAKVRVDEVEAAPGEIMADTDEAEEDGERLCNTGCGGCIALPDCGETAAVGADCGCCSALGDVVRCGGGGGGANVTVGTTDGLGWLTVGVVAGVDLADADDDWVDRRFCAGSDLGMAGGITGRDGAAGCAAAAAEGTDGAEVLASANTLKSDQSREPVDADMGGDGDGVRGGGMRTDCAVSSALSLLRLGEEDSAGGEKGSNESTGERVVEEKEDVRTGVTGCC